MTEGAVPKKERWHLSLDCDLSLGMKVQKWAFSYCVDNNLRKKVWISLKLYNIVPYHTRNSLIDLRGWNLNWGPKRGGVGKGYEINIILCCSLPFLKLHIFGSVAFLISVLSGFNILQWYVVAPCKAYYLLQAGLSTWPVI